MEIDVTPMETDTAAGGDEGRPGGEPSDPTTAGGSQPPSSEAVIDQVDDVLDQVELALSRLDDGTYGLCASCGGPLDDADLEQDPTALVGPDCAPSADA